MKNQWSYAFYTSHPSSQNTDSALSQCELRLCKKQQNHTHTHTEERVDAIKYLLYLQLSLVLQNCDETVHKSAVNIATAPESPESDPGMI